MDRDMDSNESWRNDTFFGNAATRRGGFSIQEIQQFCLSLVVATVGSIGNGILLFVHARRKPPLVGKVKVAMHFLIAMALMDFFVCAIILPIDIVTFAMEYRNYPDMVCKLFAFGRLWGLYASNFILIAISVDRYISVCHPFAPGIDFTKAKKISAACILSGMICACPNLYMFKVTESRDMKMKRCQIEEIPEKRAVSNITTYVHLAIYIISVLVIGTLYFLVYRSVNQREGRRLARINSPNPVNGTTSDLGPKQASGNELKALNVPDGSSSSSRLRRVSSSPSQRSHNTQAANAASRTGFMLLIVTAVFVSTWLPYWVVNMLAMMGYFATASQTTSFVGFFFANFFYINNAVNPIIYTFASSAFRNDIMQQLTCKYR